MSTSSSYKHDIAYLRSLPLLYKNQVINHLDLEREQEIFDNCIQTSNNHINVLTSHLSRDNLLKVLASGTRILYLSGHIDDDGRIILEDDDYPGNAILMSVNAFANIILGGIGDSKPAPQLVVLAMCCSTILHNALLQVGIRAVIGYQRKLADVDAFRFMDMLLHSLLQGNMLHDAYTTAITSLPIYIGTDFILTPMKSTMVLFPVCSTSNGIYHKMNDTRPHNLPFITTNQLSCIQSIRHDIVEQLFIIDNRVITISGRRQSYQTMAAVSAAHYLVSRNQHGVAYYDAVIFIDLHRITLATTTNIVDYCNSILSQMHRHQSSVHSCINAITNTDKYCFIFDGAEALDDDDDDNHSLCSFLERTLLVNASRCTAIITSSHAVGCTSVTESVISLYGPMMEDEAEKHEAKVRRQQSLADIVRDFYQRNNRLDPFISNDDDDVKLIEDSYIQLAVIHQEEEKEKQDDLRRQTNESIRTGAKDTSFRDERIASFEDLHYAKEVIDMNDLFTAHHKQKTMKKTKKLIVYGRAGIGKSTMCKYMSVLWAQSKLWIKNNFLLVVHISLRELIDTHTAPTTITAYDIIATMIRSQYLTAIQRNEWSIDRIKSYLIKHHQHILYILDGYDEVANIIDNDRHHTLSLTIMLRELLTNPAIHCILTSRPMTIRRIGSTIDIKFDQHLENVGFSDDNISEYVLKFMTMKQQQEALLSFLHSRKDIWGVAHIPINLELICQVWKNAAARVAGNGVSSLHGISTISELYIKLTSILYERYISRSDATTHLCQQQQRLDKNILDSELAKLAYHGITHNHIIFTHDQLAQYYTEQHLQEVINSGLLRRLKNGDVHFVHLTFQEYYAAYYFAHQIMTTSQCDFLLMNKYDKSYEMVWMFTAGILTRLYGHDHHQQQHGSDQFWHIIQAPPRDIVGVRHACISMLCWNECKRKVSLQDCIWIDIMNVIVAELSNERLFKYSAVLPYLRRCEKVRDEPLLLQLFIHSEQLYWFAYIGSHHNIVIDVLRSGLTNQSNHGDATNFIRLLAGCNDKVLVQLVVRDQNVIDILSATLKTSNSCENAETITRLLLEAGRLAIQSFIDILRVAEDNSNSSMRFLAARALAQLGAANQCVIDILMLSLTDINYERRRCSAKALCAAGICDQIVVNAFISSFENRHIPYDKSHVLETLSKLAAGRNQSVTDTLMSALNNNDSSSKVRNGAAFLLRHVSVVYNQSPVITALIHALKHDVEEVRHAAAASLGTVGGGSQSVIDALISSLKDIHQHVIYAAADALAEVNDGCQLVIDALTTTLRDAVNDVRVAAAESLCTLGVNNQSIIDVLFTDFYSAASSTVFTTLGKLAKHDGRVMNELLSALKHTSRSIRYRAVRALAQLKPVNPTVLGTMISALKEPDLKYFAASAITKDGVSQPIFHAVMSSLLPTNSVKQLVRRRFLDLARSNNCILKDIPLHSKAIAVWDDDMIAAQAYRATGDKSYLAVLNEHGTALVMADNEEMRMYSDTCHIITKSVSRTEDNQLIGFEL